MANAQFKLLLHTAATGRVDAARAYLHIAFALLTADEEYKLVKEPELFWVHALQAAQPPATRSAHKIRAGLSAVAVWSNCGGVIMQ
jgi:hypothetical protein